MRSKQNSDHESRQNTKVKALAERVMRLARDSIMMHLRFLDTALAQLEPVSGKVTGCMACDGKYLYYDPVYVLRRYQEEESSIAHIYLHIVLHCIFFHSFQYDKLEREYWDMAADMAVEETILEIGFPDIAMKKDEERARKLHWMKVDAGGLTAEKIYRYFKKNGMGPLEKKELTALFVQDAHRYADS